MVILKGRQLYKWSNSSLYQLWSHSAFNYRSQRTSVKKLTMYCSEMLFVWLHTIFQVFESSAPSVCKFSLIFHHGSMKACFRCVAEVTSYFSFSFVWFQLVIELNNLFGKQTMCNIVLWQTYSVHIVCWYTIVYLICQSLQPNHKTFV